MAGNPSGLMQLTTLLSGRWAQWLRPTQRPLWLALLIVLLLHWTVLSGWFYGASGKPPETPAARLIQFRQVTLPAPEPTPTSAAPVAPTNSSTPPAPREAQLPVPAPKEPVAEPPAPASETETPPVAQAASEAASAAATETPAPPSSDTTNADNNTTQSWPGLDSDAPLYRVALPPGFKQTYVLRSKRFNGAGVLSWSPSGGRYELSLNATVNELPVLAQHSQGRFDVTGLEPERFTDKRLARSEQAVNFQREPGFISFSAVNRRFAWRLGAQDRLSVVIQLTAILAAEANRLAAGQRFGVPVVSPRGDAEIWTFRIVGKDVVSLPSGDVNTWRVVREQRKPHDQGMELWLDEQRHHLPVRLRFGNPDERGALELTRD